MQNMPSQTPKVKLYTQQEVDDIVAETIEACAKVCEVVEQSEVESDALALHCAAAIRARGNTA